MSDADNTEASITTPAGSFAFKGKRAAEFIAFLSLALLFVLAYVLWEHKTDTRETGVVLRDAIKEMTEAQRESTSVQREWMCLSTLTPDRREREYLSSNSVCKQIARMR